MTRSELLNFARGRRGTLALIGGTVLLWLLLSMHLAERIDTARGETDNLTRDLALSRELVATVAGLKVAPRIKPSGGTLSLMTLIEQGAKRHRLDKALKKMEPSDSDHVEITLRDARFDDLVIWLGQLQSESGVTVIQANIGSAEASGTVHVSARLVR